MSNVFDFIQAKDPRYSNPLFNFFNAGQQRRQNLNNLFGEIGDTLSQFVSPRGRDQIESYGKLFNMINPVTAAGQSISNMQQGNYGSAFMDVAGFAVPTAIVAKYGGKTAVDAARYLSESLALTGGGMRDISENVYEQVIARMNQPGEMPVVGSNLGNVGHNQGPPLEIERPVIPEYSPSLKAATELPQEKGTYNQMRSMLLKRGAKEEELEWSAFDKYFRDKDQVFKSDIIDYLEKNAGSNMIDEVSKTAKGILDEDSFMDRYEMVNRYVEQNTDERAKELLDIVRHQHLEDPAVRQNNYKIFKANELEKDQFEELADYHGFPGVWNDEDQLDNFRTYLTEEFEGPETYVKFDDGVGRTAQGSARYPAFFRAIKDKDAALDEIMDEYDARGEAMLELEAYADELDVVDLREQIGLGPVVDSEQMNMPEFANFFTKGAEDYTRRTYAYQDPEGLRRGPFATHTNEHWDETDVMVHTRVGKFPLLNESGSVYHVGEIQSDFGQDIQANLKPQKEAIRKYEELIKQNDLTEKEGLFSSSFSDPEVLKEHYRTVQNSNKSNLAFAKKQLERKKSATKDEVDILSNRSIAVDEEYEIVRSAEKFLENNYKQIESASSNPYALVEYNKDLSNDMYDWKFGQGKYEESRRNSRLPIPDETQVSERNRGNAKEILEGIDLFEYLTDKNVNTPLANSFRQQKFEGENVLEAYSKIKADIKKGNDLRTGARDLSGAPLVSSTNKWVDFALRKELRNAVASGSDYMTIGSPDMVKRMTGGNIEGQKEFYGKIVPKRLEELIKKFDKDAKVEVVEIQTAFDKNMVEDRPEAQGQWKVLGVKLTDKLVNAMADKGMPIFGYLPGAVGVGGAGVLASQASQENQPGGVLNQF